MNRDRTLEILRANVADIRAAGVVALYLYGSASADRMREDSDVDLFADVDYARFGFVSYMNLRERLSQPSRQTGRFHDLRRAASGPQTVDRAVGCEGFR